MSLVNLDPISKLIGNQTAGHEFEPHIPYLISWGLAQLVEQQ